MNTFKRHIFNKNSSKLRSQPMHIQYPEYYPLTDNVKLKSKDQPVRTGTHSLAELIPRQDASPPLQRRAQ